MSTRQKLLAVHEDSRAHFGADAKAMIDQMTDDMVLINAGKIERPDHGRYREGFNPISIL